MKKIFVTDPCYIIGEDDWGEMCEMADASQEDWQDCFESLVQSSLRRISGDEKAVAGRTGFGDWTNEIDGKPFCADSGMVCVVENTDLLKQYMDDEKCAFAPGTMAYLEVEDDASYEIDRTNPKWSVVKIKSGDKSIPWMTSLTDEEPWTQVM